MLDELDTRDPLTAYCESVQSTRETSLGASDAGGCYRAQAYAYFGVEPTEPDDPLKANLGTLIHLGWSQLIALRYRPEDRQADVPLTLYELPRPVTADDVDWANHIVRDVKSTSEYAWQSWLNRGSPYESQWAQAMVYGLGLWRLDPSIEWTVAIVAIDRESGRLVEYHRELDLDWAQEVVDKLAERHAVLTAAVSVGGSPESFTREGNGPGRGFPCDWCSWTSRCWPGVSAGYRGTPQSVTIQGCDDVIEATAATYLEAAAAEKAASERRKDAAVYLNGITGTFGEYRVRTIGGNERAGGGRTTMYARVDRVAPDKPVRVSKKGPSA